MILQCISSDRAYFIPNHKELVGKCYVFIHFWEKKKFLVQFSIISHLTFTSFEIKELKRILPHSAARWPHSN